LNPPLLCTMDQQQQDFPPTLPNVTSALASVFPPPGGTPPASVPPFPGGRVAADRFLVRFQDTPDAWTVCDAILSSPGGQAGWAFFAAQTLHVKCRDYACGVGQLPPGSLEALRARLVGHLRTAGADPGAPRALTTRIALALSALACQMGWRTAAADAVALAAAGLDGTPPLPARVVLGLLSALPEEAEGRRLVLPDEGMRDDFRHSLLGSAPEVLPYLERCAAAAEDGGGAAEAVRTAEAALRCFAAWVRLVDMPASLVRACPLLRRSLGVLGAADAGRASGDLFEAAVDAVVEVVRAYPPDGLGGPDDALVQEVVPGVMALRPAFEAAGQVTPNGDVEDEDLLRGYCRIFTEMGESYMPLIMDGRDMGQVALVELVLACSAIPDNEIASITLNFWYRFVFSLETLEPMTYRYQRIDYYTPVILRLMAICVKLMQFPQDVDEITQDRMDDIKRDRYYVRDTIEDCCRVIGGNTVLIQIGECLQKECTTFFSLSPPEQLRRWQPIEACLFATRPISRYIPCDESAVLPHVMALLTRLPPVPLLRTTCCNVTGRYADWLSVHPAVVEPLVGLLIQCLSEHHVAGAAAIAIRELCERCGALSMDGGPASMLRLYQHLVANRDAANVQLVDELQVLEGVCKVLSHGARRQGGEVDFDTFAASLGTIMGPVGMALAALLAPDSGANAKQVMAEIERITAVVRYADPPPAPAGRQHLVVELMVQSAPLLESAALRFPRDVNIAEKICRCYKHALRSCGAAFAPLLEGLVKALLRNFEGSFMSPYLYAASICITEFGQDGTYGQLLFYMTNELSNTAFRRFQTLDDFTGHPDVVEEYFYLVGRAVSHCPQDLVRSPLLKSVFQCAYVGMRVQHREAHKGILVFLENALSLGMDMDGPNARRADLIPTCLEPLQAVIVSEGPAVVGAVAQALLGDLPSYSLDAGSGSLAGILWKLNYLCPKLTQDWVAGSAISSAPENAAKGLMDALTRRVGRDVFNNAVRQFVHICDRERKLHRKVTN